MRSISVLFLLPALILAPGCDGKAEDTSDTSDTSDTGETGDSGETGDTQETADADSDGYDAVSAGGDDCDDTNADIHPGAEDAWYDGVDSDCAGNDDFDQDGDGTQGGDSGLDCNDEDAAVNPGAIEICDDQDNDCDGTTDVNPPDGAVIYADLDGDGYGAGDSTGTGCAVESGTSNSNDDCNDADDSIHPGADEYCDSVDEDCDGTADDHPIDGSTFGADSDLDGFGSDSVTQDACVAPPGYVSSLDDCNDDDGAINPAAIEACDSIDNDCDTLTDEAGSTGETSYYVDADTDGEGDASTTGSFCTLPASGYSENGDDCDDTNADRYSTNTESDDGLDNDCDLWVDEDFVAAGDIVITEVARQPRVGGSSTNVEAQWFEIYNNSSRDVDMSYWYMLRSSGSTSTDAFFVDPDAPVIVPAGEYAVFCKASDYESSATAGYPLLCDYVWGDAAEASTYEGLYHDNTFNLQRDADLLAFYVGGGSSTGTQIDGITWTYSATSSSSWPRDSTYSMMLDSGSTDATSNDTNTNWCSTPSSYTWWVSGAFYEYGTPGSANPTCP